MQSSTTAASTLGLAALARLVYEGSEIGPLTEQLLERVRTEPADLGALLDVSYLKQLTGDRVTGLGLQALALENVRVYRTSHGDGSGPKILALMTAGDLMANTPLDFLLEGSDAVLYSLYLEAGQTATFDLPDHDVAFFAIGEAPENLALLNSLGPAVASWPRPMLNAHPDRIAGLTRDGVGAMFADEASILSPEVVRANRGQLETISRNQAALSPLGLAFPIIIRPTGSHAGHGLEKIDSADAVAAYLDQHPDESFFLTQFIDYSGEDGLFRKVRLVFVDGAAHVAHLAVSEHWMVHYLNAGMQENAARRDEEAAFMASFQTDFVPRQAEALRALVRRIDLDYFGVDCAETRDGRLLLFEADVAMIVHALDDERSFPYKKPVMARLFADFVAMVASRAKAPGG